MGASGDEKTKAIIVAKHLDSKSVLASVVSVKGSKMTLWPDEFVLFCENSVWDMRISRGEAT